MTDYFALLDEPRRPWLDLEILKEKYLALSAQVHPDRVYQAPPAERQAAGERYAEINAAYNCLRQPKERLRHLLELELGARPVDIQTVPAEIIDSFFEVGKLCKEVDAFLATRPSSPILQVQWFERGQDWSEKLNSLQRKITARNDELLLELKTLNPSWESANPDRTALPLTRLDEIYRLFGYLTKWSSQVQERIVQLSLV